jgi:ribosomal protein S18 acetylase RimI-like enzyme
MTSADYESLYDLWKNTEGMGLRSLDDSREGIEKFLRRNPATSFVAVENGKIIGTLLCGHDGRRGYIYHTAVAVAHRGRGIGRRLLSKAMEALRKEGVHKTALVVFASNGRGNAFWQKMGFTERPDLVYRNRETHVPETPSSPMPGNE